jgi:hypothetical protein
MRRGGGQGGLGVHEHIAGEEPLADVATLALHPPGVDLHDDQRVQRLLPHGHMEG